MDIQFVYQKKRSEFGRHCQFSDRGPELIDDYPPDKNLIREYLIRDPVSRSTLCAPVQAEHILNTMRAEYSNCGMNHVEGGWPKDVNTADEEQTKRYRRKIEKDEGFYHTMMQLFKNMENCILQNNAINIYQQYFSDVDPAPLVEKSSARTVNVYLDQCSPTRPVSHISWSPDNQTKLAVSHCNLKFQASVPNETTYSYIWEVENPNRPLLVLKPEHSIVRLEYHQKDPHSLVSGHVNGQVGVWDTRKGTEPVELSIIENSFRDPVRNVLWINSKTGTEFFSSSTDGQIKWWDLRKMSEATETLILDYAKDDEQLIENAMGCSALEYETTIPTRFMVGSEQGVIVSCNRKGKTALEKMTSRFNAHLGPVLSIQRNPGFVKNFLSIGDWTARIWSEDCRESSIMWTCYHKARLTEGAWSPTRLSVFFTTRSDGTLDVWDILQQQKQASLSVKVSDDALECLRTHDMGRLVAVGTQKGTTYLVEFSENLSMSNKNDKVLLTAMFERESKREKILEARNREIRLKQKARVSLTPLDLADEGEKDPAAGDQVVDEFSDPQVRQAEAEFYLAINQELHPEEYRQKTEQELEERITLEDGQEAVESLIVPPEEPPADVKKEKGKKKKKK